jgi:hypothetical protein
MTGFSNTRFSVYPKGELHVAPQQTQIKKVRKIRQEGSESKSKGQGKIRG